MFSWAAASVLLTFLSSSPSVFSCAWYCLEQNKCTWLMYYELYHLLASSSSSITYCCHHRMMHCFRMVSRDGWTPQISCRTTRTTGGSGVSIVGNSIRWAFEFLLSITHHQNLLHDLLALVGIPVSNSDKITDSMPRYCIYKEYLTSQNHRIGQSRYYLADDNYYCW